jgi:hypothetical protein
MTFDQIINIIINSDHNNDWINVDNGIMTSRVFVGDVNIRIQKKFDDEDLHNEDFKETWANKHPDSHARSYYYNIYFNSSLIKRIILVDVDGGRSSLPMPIFKSNKVKELDYSVAEIFDSTKSLSEYMQRSGLTR